MGWGPERGGHVIGPSAASSMDPQMGDSAVLLKLHARPIRLPAPDPENRGLPSHLHWANEQIRTWLRRLAFGEQDFYLSILLTYTPSHARKCGQKPQVGVDLGIGAGAGMRLDAEARAHWGCL